jgi:hypothetical protein
VRCAAAACDRAIVTRAKRSSARSRDIRHD